MKEKDLYEPVKDWLLTEVGCEIVYPEISDADVLGISGSTNIIVELKTRFSFKLLEQAEERLQYAQYVYIAVPYPKSNGFSKPRPTKFIDTWANEKGIGILYVDLDSKRRSIYRSNVAKFNRLYVERKRAGIGYDIRKNITEWSHRNVGGSKGGETITEYKVMIENIKRYLKSAKLGDQNAEKNSEGLIEIRSEQFIDGDRPIVEKVEKEGDRTIDQILEHCETYYSNPKPSLITTLKQEWNNDWCEITRYNGKLYFRLKDEGIT